MDGKGLEIELFLFPPCVFMVIRLEREGPTTLGKLVTKGFRLEYRGTDDGCCESHSRKPRLCNFVLARRLLELVVAHGEKTIVRRPVKGC